MPLNKEQKQKIVDKVKENIDKQKIALFVGIAGLKAEDIFGLRNKLKEKNCLLTVVKKTLLNIAFKEKNIPVDIKKLEKEVAVVSGFKDEILAAKITEQFASKNENLKILGGIFKSQFIDKEKVIALAKIPSREELLARLVGSVKAPVANFANVLQGNIKGLVYVLKQIKT